MCGPLELCCFLVAMAQIPEDLNLQQHLRSGSHVYFKAITRCVMGCIPRKKPSSWQDTCQQVTFALTKKSIVDGATLRWTELVVCQFLRRIVCHFNRPCLSARNCEVHNLPSLLNKMYSYTDANIQNAHPPICSAFWRVA